MTVRYVVLTESGFGHDFLSDGMHAAGAHADERQSMGYALEVQLQRLELVLVVRAHPPVVARWPVGHDRAARADSDRHDARDDR